MKIFLRVASSPQLLEDSTVLDSLITTEGWQTLMTFTREMARKHIATSFARWSNSPFLAAARPSTSAPTSHGPPPGMDEDIPRELYEQFAQEATGSGAGGIRICPHCTFENTHGDTDCEVCGLPL